MRYQLPVVVAVALLLGACSTAEPQHGRYESDLLDDLADRSVSTQVCVKSIHDDDAEAFIDMLKEAKFVNARSCGSDRTADMELRVQRIFYEDTNELRVDVVLYERGRSWKVLLPRSSTGVLAKGENFDHAAKRLIERDWSSYVKQFAGVRDH